MKVLFLSNLAQGMSLANAVAREGHDVTFFCRHESYRDAGARPITFVDSWRPVFKKQDLIVCDSPGFGGYEDLFRENGKLVIGCSDMGDLISSHLVKGLSALKAVGIKVPEYQVIEKREDLPNAFEFESPGLVVSANLNSNKKIVVKAKTQDQYSWALETLAPSCEVQRLQPGFYMVCEGWFNGRDWLNKFFLSFQEDEVLPDYVNGSTSMGTLTLGLASCRLSQATLEKFTEKLRSVNYRGPMAVHCNLSNGDLVATGVNFGFTYNTIEAQLEGILGLHSVFDLLYDTATGRSEFLNCTNDYMMAVPVRTNKYYGGCPIQVIDYEARSHIHYVHANPDSVGASDTWHVANNADTACVVTARGRNTEEARSRVKRTLSNVYIPNSLSSWKVGKRDAELLTLRSEGWI